MSGGVALLFHSVARYSLAVRWRFASPYSRPLALVALLLAFLFSAKAIKFSWQCGFLGVGQVGCCRHYTSVDASPAF